MSAPQPAMNSIEMAQRVETTHKAITKQLADMSKLNADLDVDAQSWSTSSASGSAAYVFVYLQVDCNLTFPSGLKLTFNGKGLVVGLGATGSLAGSATFNVDPATLRGASGITFQAFALSPIVGGFQVTWYKDDHYIGHAEFFGLGVSLGTPGGGWGSFS
jgi:hypothetical protein